LDLPYVISGSGERKDKRPAEKARALDTYAIDLQLDPEQERQKLVNSFLADRKRLGSENASSVIKDRDGRGLLVRINSSNTVLVRQHRSCLRGLPWGAAQVRRRRQIWVESWQALFKPGTVGPALTRPARHFESKTTLRRQ
jgi:hypothetical protein